MAVRSADSRRPLDAKPGWIDGGVNFDRSDLTFGEQLSIVEWCNSSVSRVFVDKKR